MRLTFLIALLIVPVGFASDAQFYEQRVVSPGGTYYAVLRNREKDLKVNFEFVQRREGLPAIKGAVQEGWAPPEKRVDLARDERDTLMGKGTLPWVPRTARVLERSAAMLLHDMWYSLGGTPDDPAIARVDASGKLRWRHSIADLFGAKAAKGFESFHGHVFWCRGWWIDEGRGVVVVYGANRVLRAIDLDTGKHRLCDAATQLAGLALAPRIDREAAYSIAIETKPEGLLAVARAAAADARWPTTTRLRASLATKVAGGAVDAEMFIATARQAKKSDARSYARARLIEALGAKRAVDVLAALLGTEKQPERHWLRRAIARAGEVAVAPMLAVLENEKAETDARIGAANVLGEIRHVSTIAPALRLAKGMKGKLRDKTLIIVGETLALLIKKPDPKALATLRAARQDASDAPKWAQALIDKAISACSR